MKRDDRGRAYAFWRKVADYKKHGTGNLYDLFFRFDFVVEANRRSGEFASSAVLRRIEDAFPPLFRTIWVDIDGQEVTSEGLRSDLAFPYNKETDTNLRKPEWEMVDKLGMVADWSSVCQSAYTSAEAILQDDVQVAEKSERAGRQIERRFRAIERQLNARIAALGEQPSDVDALEREREMSDHLQKVVSEAKLRLDAVGAIILAVGNPFKARIRQPD